MIPKPPLCIITKICLSFCVEGKSEALVIKSSNEEFAGAQCIKCRQESCHESQGEQGSVIGVERKYPGFFEVII